VGSGRLRLDDALAQLTAQQEATADGGGGADGAGTDADGAETAAPVDLMAGWSTAGAYTRPLFGST